MIDSVLSFELLVSALGMKVRDAQTLEGVFGRYESLLEEGGEDALVDLWKDLEMTPVAMEWPEKEYEPENSLKRRSLILGCQVVDHFGGNYPKNIDFEMNEGLQHLVMHGKLGLMAFLFALQEKESEMKIPACASMIEKFMQHIEDLVESLLCAKEFTSFAHSLSLPSLENEQEPLEWLRGSLQPFALMRSVYLEAPATDMTPLEWWVAHERYIPCLPNC
jgi:hypothetical protein